MDIERVYRLLGNPGRYQVMVYVLLCCNYFPVAVNHLVMTVYGAKTIHYCATQNIVSMDTPFVNETNQVCLINVFKII